MKTLGSHEVIKRSRGRPPNGIAVATQKKIIAEWAIVKEQTGNTAIATATAARVCKVSPSKVEEVL